MPKALDVLGLPVISLDTGEELGKVCDILCDSDWRLLGFLLQERSWFQEGAYIPANEVHAVGEDSLTILGKQSIQSLQAFTQQNAMGVVTGRSKLKGKMVMSAQGDYLGNVEDVYFSLEREKLVGCELSDGWLADLTEGRKRLPVTSSLALKKESLILEDPTHIQL